MFRVRFLLQALLALFVMIGSTRRPNAADDIVEELDDDTPAPKKHLGDEFVYDLTARYNEGLSANLDAVDTALLAIIGGILAIGLIVIDKLNELQSLWGRLSLASLAAAIVACVFGYLVGFSRFIVNERKDGTEPSLFLSDFVDEPQATVARAIQELAADAEINLRIRGVKRWSALGALCLLTLGTVFFAVARFTEKVIQ